MAQTWYHTALDSKAPAFCWCHHFTQTVDVPVVHNVHLQGPTVDGGWTDNYFPLNDPSRIRTRTESPKIQAKHFIITSCIKTHRAAHAPSTNCRHWNENSSTEKNGSIGQPVSADHFGHQLSSQLFDPPPFHYHSQRSHPVPEQQDQTTLTADINGLFALCNRMPKNPTNCEFLQVVKTEEWKANIKRWPSKNLLA